MIKKQSPIDLLPQFGCYRKFMKHKSNESSIQNFTVSNLLNRLELLNFCTQAETKEYYEALTECHLPPKLKNSEIEENLAKLPLQSSTLLTENYSQNQ